MGSGVAVASGVASWVGVGTGLGVGVSSGEIVGFGVMVGTGTAVGPVVAVSSGVGAGPGAPIVAEGVAVGATVAEIIVVEIGRMNGVAVGVGVWPNGRGVGIGAKTSGEIVGGMLPSAGPVQATAAASINGAPATTTRLRIDIIPGYLSEHPANRSCHCSRFGQRARASEGRAPFRLRVN